MTATVRRLETLRGRETWVALSPLDLQEATQARTTTENTSKVENGNSGTEHRRGLTYLNGMGGRWKDKKARTNEKGSASPGAHRIIHPDADGELYID